MLDSTEMAFLKTSLLLLLKGSGFRITRKKGSYMVGTLLLTVQGG